MLKKSNKISLIACLTVLLCGGLVGCGDNTSSSTSNSSAPISNSSSVAPSTNSTKNEVSSSSISTPTSPIKSIKAKEDVVSLKVSENILLSNYYILEGNKQLSSADKACTYVSSDPSIVEIKGKKAIAVNPGEATITVTSKADETKSCSFVVKVQNVFIDRDLSAIPGDDDFENEWNEEDQTGEFTTSSMLTNYFYVRGVYSTKWYLESEITINEINNDKWPKIGFVARGYHTDNTEAMVAFFINVAIGDNNNEKWNEFGFCEIAHGHWAWEGGITNSVARHHDYCYKVPNSEAISYGDTFKMGVARDGKDFHVYVNDTYAYSHKLSDELDILIDADKNPLDSNVGFFHFNSSTTFANYMVETEDISEYIPSEIKYADVLAD